MRASRTYGSVRGAPSNGRSYRDSLYGVFPVNRILHVTGPEVMPPSVGVCSDIISPVRSHAGVPRSPVPTSQVRTLYAVDLPLRYPPGLPAEYRAMSDKSA
jgi:hypothetical protein